MKVVILGSGTGTNAEAVLSAIAAEKLEGTEVVAVYSDVDNAGILERAARFKVKNVYLSAIPHRTKLDGEAQNLWIETIRADAPDLIVL
ncbi:MAG: formyltransferase family protein, partial [Opitutales bacterium]